MNYKIKKHYNGIVAGIWYTVGNMLIKATPFFTLPIFTYLLTPADFGIYNIYLSYEGILSLLISLGMSGTIKTAKFDFNTNFERYISSVIHLFLVICVVLLLIGNLVWEYIKISDWFNTWVLNLIILQSTSNAIYAVMGSKFVIQGDYIRNLSAVFGMTTLNVILSLYLCYFSMDNVPYLARITGTALGTIIVACCLVIYQNKQAKISNDKCANRYALKLGIPLLPHILSITLFSQCDKIMIQTLIGNTEAGIYSLAVTVSMVLAVSFSSIDNAWTPRYFELLNKQEYKTIISRNNILITFFAYIVCMFLLVGADIVLILADEAYWESIYALIPLSVSTFFSFMYIFPISIEYYMKKTGFISVVTIICLSINICLNYIMIRQMGYIAAAYVSCVSKLILFTLHYYIARKLLAKNIFSLRYVIGSSCCVCTVGVIAFATERLHILRYTIIIILTILMFIYLKNKHLIKFHI